MAIHPDLERVALLGWRVVPATPTKKGLWKGYLDDATCNLEIIEQWQKQHSGCCWKVLPQGSGIWALDVDVPSAEHASDGVAVLKSWTAAHGKLPSHPHGRSKNGGHLCVFRHQSEPIRSKSGYPAPGIDPRAGRNAFTISPSPGYRWAIAPWEVSPPPAPSWLLELIKPPPEPPKPAIKQIATTDTARRVLFRAVSKLMATGDGSRNDALNRQSYPVARFVAAGLMHEQEAVEALYAAARHIGLPHAEIIATIQSAFRSGYRNPVDVHQ